ncbi:hypothetical protein CHS0354_028971 [Potamilus streckersoni]|uniref:Uncharacterized protein n=1 Tax=Potamilus streckersoni TaxID=2493646 RepID=A0AAE0SB26_9BIVA|nr:hypothetical protein CHS0354_028971 [Potamilus streckersoni]
MMKETVMKEEKEIREVFQTPALFLSSITPFRTVKRNELKQWKKTRENRVKNTMTVSTPNPRWACQASQLKSPDEH